MAERWQVELRKLRELDPPDDLWQRGIAGPRRVPSRPDRGLQFGAILVALVLAAAGVAGIIRAVGGGGGRTLSVSGPLVRFVDPQFGWTIRYPGGMLVQPFHSGGFPGPFEGARITNFQPDLAIAGHAAPPMGWLQAFPADGVAVQIWIENRLPGPPPLRDSTFPLAATSFSPIQPYAGGQEPAPRYRYFDGDGFTFSAAIWIGPEASSAAQRAAWAVLESLRFPPLRTGTIWQHTFYVLGLASRYPVGSVTALAASSFPRGLERRGIYLIHAPRAFYVIPMTYERSQSGNAPCAVGYDRRTLRFYCAGTNLRWDRAGQALGSRAGKADTNLGLYIVTVAHDGHILFSPFFGALLPMNLRGNPWG